MNGGRVFKILGGNLALFHGIIVAAVSMSSDMLFIVLLFIGIPAALFWCILNTSKTNLFHLAMIALLGWAILLDLDDADSNESLLFASWMAASAIAVLVLDLVFDRNIGRPVQKSFVLILRESYIKVGFSLSSLIILLVVFYSQTVETLGTIQLMIMGALHVAMLFAIYLSSRLQMQETAITWLTLGGIWNLGSAMFSLQVGKGNLTAILIPAYWFFSASYKLRRCVLPTSGVVNGESAPNPASAPDG